MRTCRTWALFWMVRWILSFELMVYILIFGCCTGCHENYLAVKFTDPHIIKVGNGCILFRVWHLMPFIILPNHSSPDCCMPGGIVWSRLYANQNTKKSTIFSHALHPFCGSSNPCSLCHISPAYHWISSFNDPGAVHRSMCTYLPFFNPRQLRRTIRAFVPPQLPRSAFVPPLAIWNKA